MSDLTNSLADIPDVSFIENLTEDELTSQMITDFIAKYQETTGKTISLPKDDINRLILQACATQIYQAFQYLDRAGKLNLLKYSYGDYLENIAALKGVTRAGAIASTVTVRFTLSTTRTATTTIPSGTQVSTGNYDVYWETTEDVTIAAGLTYVDIVLTCTETGTFSNGYTAGEITELVDPVTYVESVANITESSGGTDEESDEDLAERAYLAPATYTTAGSESAYKELVYAYSSEVTDCYIYSTSSAQVNIVILQNGGFPSSDFRTALGDYLEDLKPLTDSIYIEAPTSRTLEVAFDYYISSENSLKEETIKEAVEAAIDDYITDLTTHLGRANNPSRIAQLVMDAGAERVTVTYPTTYTTLNGYEYFSSCTPTINYGGLI